jgi:hypothetical protein
MISMFLITKKIEKKNIIEVEMKLAHGIYLYFLLDVLKIVLGAHINPILSVRKSPNKHKREQPQGVL